METNHTHKETRSRKIVVLMFYLLVCSIITGGFLFMVGCASVNSNTSKDVSKDSVLKIVSSENIRWVKVYYYPEDASLSEAMNERDLERQFYGSIIISDYQYSNFRTRLINALTNSTLEKNDRVSRDLRWGCVFYDGYANRLLSLYFTAGNSGVIDHTQVNTDGKVVEFLRSEFDCITQMW